MLYWSENQ